MTAHAHTAPVIVVGAGPAGSTTALLLARAGIEVLLLDRAGFPRAKPCGDCLSAQATLLLRRLGLLDDVLACAPARLVGWRIQTDRGEGFDARFSDVRPDACDALALPRSELDAVLVRAAAAAGVRFQPGARVIDLLLNGTRVGGVRYNANGRTHEVRGCMTIGADGLRSVVARRLNAVARAPRLRKLSLTAHLPLDRTLDGYGDMYVARGLAVGIAPVSARDNVWNVTVVADAPRFGRDVARDARAFFGGAVQRVAGHAARPDPAVDLLASGPFDLPVRQIVHDGAALVGDAAGYFDPFTGQGVYQAMAGATLLADALATVLLSGRVPDERDLDGYRRAHARLTRGPRRVQHLVEAVLSRPTLAGRALDAIAARPQLARTLLGITGDLLPAGTLLSPRLLFARNP